ncbi:unnamed protein product [Ambrosiozyma monospora]|uniref:Unnamed protein product n=1 Tax=Ambrosiozyma monospora TaxID=43982 RepID=A0ACB5TDM2_AMBMO|nr:unnamed protein product [Ambrosiozyma monospora]
MDHGIHQILELGDIDIQQLKKITTLLDDNEYEDELTGECPKTFQKVFPMLNKDPIQNYAQQLSRLILQCAREFNKNYTSKKVFLFTDCDKPYNGNNGDLRLIVSRLNMFNSEGTDAQFIPFLLPGPSGTSDLSEFNEVLGVRQESNLMNTKFKASARQINISDIRQNVGRYSEIKRMAYNCALELNGIYMSVKGYAMFKPLQMRTAQEFYEDDIVYRVVTKTKKLRESSGREVEPSDLRRVVGVGDPSSPDFQCIDFPPALMKKIHDFNEKEKPILRVLGFRNIEHFNPAYTIGTPTLMVPDSQGVYTKSDRAFATLYQSMVRKRSMAVVWGIPTRVKAPGLYYLIPTHPALGFKTSTENYPDGLAMIPLPFKDDIRSLPDYLTKQYNPTEIILPNPLEPIVKKFTEDKFEPFENPKLTYAFDYMELNALQEVDPYLNPETEPDLKMSMLS